MKVEPDILVIGGGMAGLVAGSITASNGLDTLLVRRGKGATAYSSGAIDVMGYPPEGADIREYFPSTAVPFKTPAEGLEVISSLYPYHPYGMLGYGEDNEDMTEAVRQAVRESLIWLKDNLRDSCAPLVGSFEKNIQPITVLGTVKPTCLIQETMWSDNLNDDSDNVLIFIGFRGHPEFNASAATQAYLEHQVRSGNPPYKVGHGVLEVTPFGKPYNISGIELAHHFDHEGAITELSEALQQYVDRFGATHIAIPPVLGLQKSVQNRNHLEKALNVSVFELLSFPPSVPGLRLQRALDDMYIRAGGTLLIGHEAVSASVEGKEVQKVNVRSPRRELEIHPKAVILATGKFIGGGLEADGIGLKEPVFNLLSVTPDLNPTHDMFPWKATSTISLNPNGHDLFGSGLTVDTSFRPIGDDSIESAANLFCAGSLVALYNYSLEKSGLGVALTSGRKAGIIASKMAREVD